MTESPLAQAHYHHPDLAIDQKVALKTAATRLQREFEGTFGVETIERFLHSSYDQFAGRATVVNFLPLLYRTLRPPTPASPGQSRGQSPHRQTHRAVPVHPQRRSLADGVGILPSPRWDNAVAWSGGSEPGAEINPAAVEAMAEVGIDITGEFPKPWTEEILQAADVIITMGCGDACPLYPRRRYEEWALEDPAGLDVASIRPIREEIETRVRHPLAELYIPTA